MTLRRPAITLALAGAAWALTVHRMQGMDAGPGTALGGLGWFVGVWVVMMAAMMLPAVAPAVARVRGAGLFLVGYLAAWTLAGVAAYGLFEGVRALDLSWLAWHRGGRWLAGAVIVGAALYELTPAKRACLARCRAAAADRGVDGVAGGLRYGAGCFGCSWAMMAALFALGVMSVGWMVLVAGMIAAERLLPWPAAAMRAIALLLVVLGVAVAAVPGRVPGLTVPGHSPMRGAMRSMGSMR
jgi:predicted metal-binding membrane protein